MAKSRELGRIEASLDAKDWIILEEVQRDARLPFAELARRAGLSPPAAAERLRRMEDAGLVTGHHAHIAPEGLGLTLSAFIEVAVKRADYPSFHAAIADIPWVLECHHVSGRASFVLRVAVPGTPGLELLIGRLSQFGETSTSLILSTSISRREFRNASR